MHSIPNTLASYWQPSALQFILSWLLIITVAYEEDRKCIDFAVVWGELLARCLRITCQVGLKWSLGFLSRTELCEECHPAVCLWGRWELCFSSYPVAGLISPWNLPLYLLTWKIAPAIAAGNTVIAKPSEMTSVTAWMFCKLLDKAGNRMWGQGEDSERGHTC